jgi:phage head maturation protease
MAKDPDQFHEVIAPGAFDHLLPAEVPVTDKPGGGRIGAAKVTKDDEGLVVSMTIPVPDSERD